MITKFSIFKIKKIVCPIYLRNKIQKYNYNKILFNKKLSNNKRIYNKKK